MTGKSRHDGVFRALLRLFPSEFRGDFGDQMADDFRDQRQDSGTRRGRFALLRLWSRTAVDVIWRAPQEHLDVFRRDASYAIRVLRKRPASTAIVVLSLAVGIGLNTAVFSVVSGVIWRRLPFTDSTNLVRIFDVNPKAPDRTNDVTPGEFVDFQNQTRAFSFVAAAARETPTLVEPGEPEAIPGLTVSEGFFETLGVKPIVGRTFVHDDYQPSIQQNQQAHQSMQGVVIKSTIISTGLWHRRFGARPDIVGQKVRLTGGASAEIIGVMGSEMASFTHGYWTEAQWWFPEAPDRVLRRAGILDVIGRLAPGVSVSQAQAELDIISANLAASFPSNRDHALRPVPMLDTVVKDVRAQLTFLFGAVLCVLLVTCVNVVHLFLANASGRRIELATRVALGATRAHLVRQTLTESVLLAALGGIGGLLLAAWAVPLLIALAPAGVPRLHELGVDWSTFAFAAAASAGVALFCGLAASLPLTMLKPWSALGSARSGGTIEGRRIRHALAVSEIAVALMLVVASMLMIRTMRVYATLDLGFNPQGVVVADIAVPAGVYADAQLTRAHEAETKMIEEVRRLPGVVAVGVGGSPLGMSVGMGGMKIPGDSRDFGMVGAAAVSPGYFEALGARLVAGRFFSADDRADSSHVVALSESTARRFWPAGDAIGKTLLPDAHTPFQVVGIVGDMAEHDLETKGGGLFFPHIQSQHIAEGRMVIRTNGDPLALVPAIKSIFRRVNPEQPFPGVVPIQEEIDLTTAPRRFILRLIGAFSVLGLSLAIIGIYGVLAESVANRVPEIGVRMALGAQASDVMRLILRQGARMVFTGLALGLTGAILLRHEMTTMVFGIRTLDPLSYASACAALLLAAFAACAIPARRAARLDPVVALRSE